MGDRRRLGPSHRRLGEQNSVVVVPVVLHGEGRGEGHPHAAPEVGAADAGFKYQEIQEDTEGVRESICSLYYDALLNRLAMKVLGLQDRIFLTAPPDLATVEVRVDDAFIHQRERHGWRYDAGENSIVFDGYAVPFPKSEVVVTYNQWIGPPRDWDDTDEADQDKEDQDNETTTSEEGE